MRKVGPDGSKAGGELVEVAVWSDTCQGTDQGDAIATWLCAFLEMVRACVRGCGGANKHVGGCPAVLWTSVKAVRLSGVYIF